MTGRVYATINDYLNKEPQSLRFKSKARKIKKKAKIVKPVKTETFFDPKNIPKLKKIEEKINAMQIPKKWI